MIDDYIVRQSNDPRIVVPQERAPKNAVTAASLNIVRDKERNKSEMITDKAYRNQEFKHTHTQCVLHIIRLRLIIFHTPKNFHGRNKI